MIYIVGLVWGELRSLYAEGLLDYVSDLWNIVGTSTFKSVDYHLKFQVCTSHNFQISFRIHFTSLG